MAFKRGKATGPLKKAGAARGTGTTVYFHPDPTIFPKVEFRSRGDRERLEVVSLHPQGRARTFDNEVEGKKEVFQHEEGLVDFSGRSSPSAARSRFTKRHFVLAPRRAPRLATFSWRSGPRRPTSTCAATSSDPDGVGRQHENGLRAGLGKAVPQVHRPHNLSPKAHADRGRHREGFTGVVSIFIEEPHPGADQGRLNNPELTSAIDCRRPGLEHWLNTNRTVAEAIVAADHRSRAGARGQPCRAGEVTRKTPRTAAQLPGKLSDCTAPAAKKRSCSSSRGDSAGGSAKQGATAASRRSFAARQGDETPRG